ncbi:Mannose-1-phosphate guanylyltransferase [Anatilimnocola aggregata]|uniref:mannose-1-phosphate guanylyltransferase n=1 Tax=Anatilimnocola aggregata TaxID=2528021 RepID=A0A517YNL8_9BACT|nr:mannose-1-phosphate guanylyltransferase [Anatilimnocola aggregata]QDU31823.1 Mannose-1-phosphate guanylyltransferase [Anatilimnocola aggregata]
MLHAVIMAGGAGTRFWPLSRTTTPKQLLALVGAQTMIQQTVARLDGLVSPERLLIVTNQRLVQPMGEQLPQLASSRILGEPCKRDTAPCVGLAALLVSQNDPNATMAVMPADHLIQPTAAFQAALKQAVELVEQEPARIVTFGIRPTYAAEIFGYIECGDPLPLGTGKGAVVDSASAYRATRFREKPARSVAEQYLAAGNFFWNSGIFVWKAKTIVDALTKFEPQMMAHLQTIASAWGQPNFNAVFDREFTEIRGKSIDFAVMEHYPNIVVLKASFTWDDVGSWQAIARTSGSDAQGNTIQARHVGIRTTGSIVRGTDDHLLVTLGMQDCVVVHTPDATLVAHKSEEEAIREVVKELEQRGWREYL